MQESILICDDEVMISDALSEYLKTKGYFVTTCVDGHRCMSAIDKQLPDVLLLDMRMPHMDGLEVLKQLQKQGYHFPVIVITGHGDIENAIEATKLGAAAYLQKPFKLFDVEFQISKVLKEHRLNQQVSVLKQAQKNSYEHLIGESSAIKDVFAAIEQMTKVDVPTILLTGESGTGKNLVAQALHDNGVRKDNLFVTIDCTALSEHLVESELFGHEKGSFTDAHQQKRGLLETAQGGTIFLDEIGDMPLSTQAKLLRALESRTFRRVGGLRDFPLDMAVIAATNRSLENEVKIKRFREDLFFRLNVVPLRMPSLRERLEDIPLLLEHFIAIYNKQFGKQVQGVSQEALAVFQRYNWPGNIRELRNIIERIMILMGEEKLIEPKHLPKELQGRNYNSIIPQATDDFVLPQEGISLEENEKNLIKQALGRTKNNQSKAAKLLGISRFALRYRMEKYGLMPQDKHLL